MPSLAVEKRLRPQVPQSSASHEHFEDRIQIMLISLLSHNAIMTIDLAIPFLSTSYYISAVLKIFKYSEFGFRTQHCNFGFIALSMAFESRFNVTPCLSV